MALEPNKERVRGDFLRNVVTFALPGAVMIIASVLISCAYGVAVGLEQYEFSTLCVVLASVAGMNLVVRLSMPYNPVRVVLTVICAAAPPAAIVAMLAENCGRDPVLASGVVSFHTLLSVITMPVVVSIAQIVAQ